MLNKKITKTWNLIEIDDLVRTPYSDLFQAFSTLFGRAVVVKIAKSRRDSEREAKALKIFSGQSSVYLLDYLEDEGAALMERIVPGTPLSTLFSTNDMEATKAFCYLANRLPRAIEGVGNVQSLEQRLEALQRPSKIVEAFRQKALKIANVLLQDKRPSVLLHGDLHHDNIILDQGRGYIAIDPKGIIGEMEYEIATFMCNPINELVRTKDLVVLLKKRAEIIGVELGLDQSRMKRWTYVHAIMACLWAEEDGFFDSSFFKLAQLLDSSLFDE